MSLAVMVSVADDSGRNKSINVLSKRTSGLDRRNGGFDSGFSRVGRTTFADNVVNFGVSETKSQQIGSKNAGKHCS